MAVAWASTVNRGNFGRISGSNHFFGPLDNWLGLDYFLSVRMASEEQTQVFVQNGLTREEKIRKQNCPKLPRDLG